MLCPRHLSFAGLLGILNSPLKVYAENSLFEKVSELVVRNVIKFTRYNCWAEQKLVWLLGDQVIIGLDCDRKGVPGSCPSQPSTEN